MARTAELVPLRDPDASWMARAACASAPAHKVEFFPEVDPIKDPRARLALAICATCPVKHPCGAFAETNGIGHGIWGGLSAGRRRRGDQPAQSPSER